MTETRNIDGIPAPKKGTADKESVDPDKFQKALKVEKSEEAEKREKRNRPKKQEELDDEEDDVGASIPVPEGLFKEYMQEDQKGPSVLDAGKGTKVNLVAESDSTSTSGKSTYIGDVEEGQKSNISVGTTESSSSEESVLEDDDPLESPPPSNEMGSEDEPPPQMQAPPPVNIDSEPEMAEQPEFPSFDNDKQEPATAPPPQKEETKTKDTKKPDAAKKKESSHEKKETEKTKPQDSVKEQKPEKTPELTKLEDPKEAAQKLGSHVSDTHEKKKGTLTGDDKVEKKPSEVKKEEPLPSTEAMGDTQKDHKEKETVVDKGDDIVAPISVPLASPTGVAALEMSPFSNMPKDVFDVFEKMVGMMTVQKDSGKSVTTITLNMPNSVFNKSELVLEHYDTAPHAFNVQLLGSPEAIDRFAKNMQGLNSAITESKLPFSIHVLPPKLSKNYVGRVVGTDSNRGDREEKDGEESN